RDTPAHEQRGGARAADVVRALRDAAAVVGDHAGEGAGSRRTIEIADELQIGAPKPEFFGRYCDIEEVPLSTPMRRSHAGIPLDAALEPHDESTHLGAHGFELGAAGPRDEIGFVLRFAGNGTFPRHVRSVAARLRADLADGQAEADTNQGCAAP